MRGLLEKDFRLLLQSKQSFICFFVLTIVLGFSTQGTFILGYFTFLMIALLTSTISYDELDHGFEFLFTLPVNRNIYVREKYVLCMGGAVIAWLISVVLYFLMLNLHNATIVPGEEILKALTFLPIAMLFLSLMIPLQLKFGVEKSRFVMLGVCAAIGVLIYVVLDQVGLSETQSVFIMCAFGQIPNALLVLAEMILGICVAIISCFCSNRIMRKKEL